MPSFDVNRVRAAARGRWREILNRAGISNEYLSGKPGPCPFCKAGVDRWVFDDKEGAGTAFCRQCDAKGDGFKIVAMAMGLDPRKEFGRVLEAVADTIGLPPTVGRQIDKEPKHAKIVMKTWDESQVLDETTEGPIQLYLKSRGLGLPKNCRSIRFHPRLPAMRDKELLGFFPSMVTAITDANDELIGIHRTYLTPDGKKAPIGKDTKKSLGSAQGGCIRLYSDVKDSIGIAEGIETALSIQFAIELPMIAAQSGSTMHLVPIDESVSEVHIWADLDRNESGLEYAQKLARRLIDEGRTVYLHFPPGPLSEDCKTVDWNDVLLDNGPDVIRLAFESDKPWKQVPAACRAVSGPAALPPLLDPLPKLDMQMVPEVLRSWIEDHANLMQLPPEFIAGCSLVMIGSAIGRRCGVYPMQHNDWLVIPCLWGGLVAPPSVLKTPAMTAAISPLRKVEADARGRFSVDLTKFEREAEEQSFKLEELQKRLRKFAKDGIDDENSRQTQTEYRQLKDSLEAKRPKLSRYSTNDATTEKLGEILSENPDGIFVFRDELFGFLRNLEKPGRENDRAFYLEAWNGLGSYTFDRIGRGTIHVPALCISIFGGIQPDRLKSYFSEILEGSTGDDGFLSRFQILLYPDLPSTYKYTDRSPNTEARRRVNEVVEKIVTTDFVRIAPEVDRSHGVPAFRFSESGQDQFKNWYESFSQRLLGSKEDPAFISHLGKYRSLVPALALIFHVVENCHSDFFPTGISEDSVVRALYWVNFLEMHARRVYGQVIRSDVFAAHALANKIRQGRLLSGSTIRDVYRNEWKGLKTPEIVRQGLSTLSELGWLNIVESNSGHGPSSEIIVLHSDLQKHRNASNVEKAPGAANEN